MALLDDIGVPLDESELNRRRFMKVLGSGALMAAAAGTAVTAVDYLSPNVLYEEETRFRIRRPEEIGVGTVIALPKQKVYVVHKPEGFIAFSTVCTHLGCMTRYEPENNRIFCPCHGSQYTTEGIVTAGPAPKALPRLELTLEKGFLVVDTRKQVSPDFILRYA
ncbi:MAG TPA: ubiquinol-cytochrome c reductase iron-sulfur subunit [Candidatus Deferrimicrobium sp.]|nr:ubiquinol-cytochrome c reductase iron-sulfur subunit [Candidatus Deferrimicrobium sp.]